MTPIPANIPDGELSALVAKKVGGWRDRIGRAGPEKWEDSKGVVFFRPPPYATSADAILPLIGNRIFTCGHDLQSEGWLAQLWRNYPGSGPESGCPEPPHSDIEFEANASTLPRAICFLLLLSTGKFTITTPAGTKAL